MRTDILVVSEFWDNDIPGYGKTRKLLSADKKRGNTLVADIITKLTDEYDAETADAVWVREVVNRCVFPEVEQKRSTPTFIDRFEQYLNEHKMAENSYNIYKPTLNPLAELIQRILNPSNRFVVNVVDIL